MADLRQLQEAVTASLMQPLTRQDRLKSGIISDFIREHGSLSGFQRLEIYARQYWFRLLDCLFDDFPALRAFLGSRRFMRLCEEYLAAHPSQSWTLRNLGSHLPDFITDPAAQDIARVEWAQTLAFDEALLAPVAADFIATADAATLHLALQPCVVLVQLDHGVDRFITALGKQTAEGRNTASQAYVGTREHTPNKRRPRLKKERVHLAVHRHDNRLYFKRLSAEAWQLLTGLRDGLTLLEALDAALVGADPHHDWPTEVRAWFTTFGQLGWLTSPNNILDLNRP